MAWAATSHHDCPPTSLRRQATIYRTIRETTDAACPTTVTIKKQSAIIVNIVRKLKITNTTLKALICAIMCAYKSLNQF